jgi:uncharacterized membrane protein YebE (DUF533 family)
MLTGIKAWLYGAVIAVWAGMVAWAYVAGRRYQRAKSGQQRADAMKDAKQVREDVQTSDDQRLVDILTGRVRR